MTRNLRFVKLSPLMPKTLYMWTLRKSCTAGCPVYEDLQGFLYWLLPWSPNCFALSNAPYSFPQPVYAHPRVLRLQRLPCISSPTGFAVLKHPYVAASFRPRGARQFSQKSCITAPQGQLALMEHEYHYKVTKTASFNANSAAPERIYEQL